jgi:hypothetical protein
VLSAIRTLPPLFSYIGFTSGIGRIIGSVRPIRPRARPGPPHDHPVRHRERSTGYARECRQRVRPRPWSARTPPAMGLTLICAGHRARLSGISHDYVTSAHQSGCEARQSPGPDRSSATRPRSRHLANGRFQPDGRHRERGNDGNSRCDSRCCRPCFPCISGIIAGLVLIVVVLSFL